LPLTLKMTLSVPKTLSFKTILELLVAAVLNMTLCPNTIPLPELATAIPSPLSEMSLLAEVAWLVALPIVPAEAVVANEPGAHLFQDC